MPSRVSKMFDELFPTTAGAFTTQISGYSRIKDADLQLDMWAWQANIEADVLLVFAASHRTAQDLFTRIRFVDRFSQYRELVAHMSGKTRNNNRQNTSDAPEWKGFLDRKLDDNELAALDEWKPNAKQVWDLVDALISSGFRLTLSYNAKTKLASVTQIDNREKSVTAGYALSSADTDGALALKAALFKHFEVLKEDWTSISDSAPRARRG